MIKTQFKNEKELHKFKCLFCLSLIKDDMKADDYSDLYIFKCDCKKDYGYDVEYHIREYSCWQLEYVVIEKPDTAYEYNVIENYFTTWDTEYVRMDISIETFIELFATQQSMENFLLLI